MKNSSNGIMLTCSLNMFLLQKVLAYKQSESQKVIYLYLLHVVGQNVTKKQLCYKISLIREVGKKTHKKEMDNPSFYDVTWLIFKTRCPVPITTKLNTINMCVLV